ncbi:hypothetical protein [Clostridium saccharoperbutylacetonicum]|uniref:hypothetical protein n=1 Tax=Clostridium saccharoperbutylacetonicum TaxID=36745 RepID=UPI0039E9DC89
MKKLVSLIIIIIGSVEIMNGCITKSSKFAITNVTTEKQRLDLCITTKTKLRQTFDL